MGERQTIAEGIFSGAWCPVGCVRNRAVWVLFVLGCGERPVAGGWELLGSECYNTYIHTVYLQLVCIDIYERALMDSQEKTLVHSVKPPGYDSVF